MGKLLYMGKRGNMAGYQLSNRQYNVLRMFKNRGMLSLEQVLNLDQRPLAGLVRRELVMYARKTTQSGFVLSERGYALYELFQRTEIFRKNPEAPLAKVVSERMGGNGSKSQRATGKVAERQVSRDR